jgi:hypothetical protein
MQQVRVLAVRMQVRGDDARLVGRREHDRARAVAEEHAGSAVGPVHDAAQALDADHERAARLAEAHELVGHRERVDEAAAGRLQRKGRAAVDAEPLLQQRPGVGEDAVGRGGADDDEVDVRRRHARGTQRAARRVLGEDGARFVRRRDVAPLDPGARADPLVAGLDDSRGRRWSAPSREGSCRCRRCAKTACPLLRRRAPRRGPAPPSPARRRRRSR